MSDPTNASSSVEPKTPTDLAHTAIGALLIVGVVREIRIAYQTRKLTSELSDFVTKTPRYWGK